MRRRIDILDAWRTLAIVLMCAYHFLYDLYIFGVLSAAQMFSAPLNILERFICCSFILLAGASARFSRNNLRHGLIVLTAGAVVEIGAAVGGQVIRWGVLMLLGSSMVLWHFMGKSLQKLPKLLMAAGSGGLFFLTRWWTERITVSVKWLYPLGFMFPGFRSADYFPLLPWSFLFLLGTVLGGWCLDRRDNRLLTMPLPKALTWPGRHSLIIYVLHQPVLYGISYLLWGS
ncbi:MAG: DUF1624 domain-containing protein [Oscillospiraceae bacterium]|nr:DUF1624 domain-containing protein [Oscillospiraceae bacterium]